MDEGEIRFHFIKSPDCREILVDGAFGGLSPRGRITMAVYTERQPIPRETVHAVKSDTELGEELREKRVSREHLVRIVEGVLHMDLAAAKVVHSWLGQRISDLEQLQSLAK